MQVPPCLAQDKKSYQPLVIGHLLGNKNTSHKKKIEKKKIEKEDLVRFKNTVLYQAPLKALGP